MFTLKIVEPPSTRRQGALTGAALQRAKYPMKGKSGRAALRILRYGPGSVNDQFLKQKTMGVGGDIRWPKTEKFGTRKAPRKTLQRSGKLKRAWLGREPESKSRTSRRSASVSVNSKSPDLKYANIHQRGGRIRAKEHNPENKHSDMVLFLGKNYGVWLSDHKLAFDGVKIPRRAISLNTTVSDRVADMVSHYVVTGKIKKV